MEDILNNIIKYYGEDKRNLIMSAFNSCEVVYADSVEDYYEKYLGNTCCYGVKALFDLCISINSTNEFRVLSKIILNKNVNYSNTSDVGSIVHEIIHLVKSYVNPYLYSSNTITIRTGCRIITLCNTDGKVCVVNEIGKGLEEELTCYDEEMVMKRFYDKKYVSFKTGISSSIRNMLKIRGLSCALENYLFYDDRFLLDVFCEHNGIDFDTLLSSIDNYYGVLLCDSNSLMGNIRSTILESKVKRKIGELC